ncbi:uncharacterized protein LOC143297367 [Babylonia areolata]|uniref:uncharacterized protein LOC143297367 n=1 Tax=Babylonia areolata TaxID=304850 RepID=UPI003FD225E7
MMTLGLPAPEGQKRGEDRLVQEAITSRLTSWRDWEEFPTTFASSNWRLNKLDFSGQQSLAEGGAIIDMVYMLTAPGSQQILHVTADPDQVSNALSQGLRACVTQVKQQVPWVHDPVDSSCFELVSLVPRHTLTSQQRLFHQISPEDRTLFNERQPYPHMGKILDLMEKAGWALYMQGSSDSLCVTSMQSYTSLVSTFLTTTPPKSQSIPCLGDAPTAFWDRAAIDDFLQKNGPDVQGALFLKLIVRQGLVLPLRYVPKQPGTTAAGGVGADTDVTMQSEAPTMCTAYVPVSALPESHPSLDRLWPGTVVTNVHYADLFFTLLPGLPPSVLTSVMRHILKVYRPRLVWRTGLLIQQGLVDLRVQQWYNSSNLQVGRKDTHPHGLDGTPALVLSARIPMMPSENHSPLTKIKSNKCLWGLLETVQTICEYVFLKHHLYPVITTPCDLCCEFTVKKALDRTACYHLDYYALLASEDQKYTCRVHKQQNVKIPYKIGIRFLSIVPFHNFSWLRAADSWRRQLWEQTHYRPPDPDLPCHLCEEGREFLCQHCHICNHCVHKLAKYEKFVKPGFVRPALVAETRSKVKEESEDVGEPAKVRFRGPLLFLKKDQEVFLSEPLTPVYFSCLSLIVFRGYDYFVQGHLVDGKMVKFKGLSGCFFDEENIEHGDSDYKCREGSLLEVKLRFSKTPGKSILSFHLDRLMIKEHEVEGWEVRLSIKKKVAGACLIHAAGVKTGWQLHGHSAPEMGSVVEYLSTSDPAKVTKAMFTSPEKDEKYVALTATGGQIESGRDVLIRPVGYAKLKGLQLQEDIDLKPPPGTVKFPLYLWKFSQHQVYDCLEDLIKSIRDPADLIASCRHFSSPSSMFANMEKIRQKTEEALFANGQVDYSDTAVMLLPQHLTAEDLRTGNIPSYLLSYDLKAHPLCYVRADANSVMTVAPTYNLPTQVECFRLVHMIDNHGFPLPTQSVALRPLLWAWTMMLLQLEKEGLSSYSKLLEGLEGIDALSPQQIWHGLRVVLKKIALLLFMGSEGMMGQYYFHSFDEVRPAAVSLRKLVHNHVNNDPGKFGMEHLSMLFTEEKLLVCPGHAHIWQARKEITEIPQVILTSHPQFIYSLLLADNQLSHLPGSIFIVLSGLKDLDLTKNHLTALPEEVGHCRHLQTLCVVENRLLALPDSLARCTELNRLDISHNHFTKFPEVITKLTNMRRLYAHNLQLTRLPDNLGDLHLLRKLYLNGNCFTALPPSITTLKHLCDLSLNGVAWCKVKANRLLSKQHFEDMLVGANLMRWLDRHDKDKSALFQQFDEDANGTLDQKEIGKLNANVFHLFPRFGYMGSDPPDDDMPSGFPMEIMELESLEYLSLQFQGLVSVPAEIGRLKNLRTLNLSHNPNLLSVSAHVAQLPLKRLEMEDCPVLKTPPKEIRAKGFTSTFAFLKRLLSGSVDCKRTKLMMVGLGGAGKTSLVKALMSGKDKAEMTIGEEITDGIDICPWTVETEEGPLTFSVWDFAGQTVYYNTHQFFLSDRAVYLLLWNIRLGHEHAGLDFWLSSISVHAPKAPIFVVGTHVDQVAKVELPMREMKQRYNQIADFHFVSSFSGQGIGELRERMMEVTLQQQYMGEKIPGVWLGFEDNLKMITDRSVIPYTELENIASQSGIFEASEVVQAVQFLHELGSLQHFTNDFLKDQVVINPQWIVDVMACVVSVKDSAIKEGRLRHEDIGLVWKDYPESLHPWLLRLTEEYDLTFPLKDEQVNLVPCLLTEKEPEFEWPEVEKGSGLLETKMTYKFDYLPAGLFNRGQVRLHEFSDSSLVWKRGSYLRKNGHLCLVRQTRDSELVVRAQGPRPDNILFLVHEVFEGLILESFQGVTYDYLLPCPECLRLYLKGPHMFSASIVRRAAELKAPFLQCLKYFHTISIVELQACMPPEGTVDFDLHLVQAVRGLKELQRDLAADIFVSFCKKDEAGDKPGAVTPARVLADMEQLGYKSWVASSNNGYSMDEMAKAIMDAPLFVAFMTNAYVADEESCNLFKYARLTLKKQILLVTIGTGMEWRQSKLGILLSDEVYINMQQPDRYPSKLTELKTALTDRLKKGTGEGEGLGDPPPCFISYCWQNSARAVALGSRTTEGATGFGDPRDIKDYLAGKGIDCWIDVERVGLHGLFEDIGEGLVNAKVVLVCVSDQYAASNNCVVEFRFVAKSLKLPVVLAVVGSGSQWRATEVGVLSQGFPVVSFQESQTPAVYDRLVQLIQPYMTSDTGVKASEKAKATSKDHKTHSFQELCELAQRKFVRQLVVYAEAQDMAPYPRLFLVDFPKLEGQTGQWEGKGEADGRKHLSGSDFHHAQFQVNFLCEHEEGWHVSGDPLTMMPEFSLAIEEFAPFLSRILAIAKYSKRLALNCQSQPLGNLYLQWLEKSPQIAEVRDFQQSYQKLRQTVAEADAGRTMGNLARCHLPNGRMVWLCERHRQNSRVTVLSDSDTVSSSHHATETIGVDYFLQALREMGPNASRLDLRCESRSSGPTPLPPTPEEDAVTPQPPDSAPSSSKVKDTSSSDTASAPPPQISKRTSKSKMKSVRPLSEQPERPLQRQASQLKFTPNKSRACAVM